MEFWRSFNAGDLTSHGSAGGSSTALIEDLDIDGDEDSEVEPHVPLFLHLTASVRSNKEVSSQTLDMFPTCLSDLRTCISGLSGKHKAGVRYSVVPIRG